MADVVGPLLAVDERVDVEHGALVVFVELVHQLHLVVVDRSLDQPFVELSGANLCCFGQQQVAHFVQRLPGFGAAGHEERSVVGLRRGVGIGREHLLLLVQVEVNQACLPVVEDRTYDVRHVVRGVRCGRQPPAQHDARGLGAIDLLHHGRGDRLFGLEFQFRQVGVGLHVAEVLVDRCDHLVGIEVARDADGHVVGHVVGLVVVLDVGDRRVLEALLRSQHGLRAVGMVGEERGVHRLPDFAAVLRQRHVFLFVDGLQFGVEATDHGIAEAVGLDFSPVVDLVRRDVLDVNGHVLRREGVGPVGADGGHQFVVFVGNGDLRSLVADRVDAVVDRRALGFVRGLAVDLEEPFDLVEHGFLGGVVGRSELFGSLEHQVFEVVCQTGRLGGVVLAADPHGDGRLDAGLLLHDAHIDLQSVGKRVNPGFQRIARHRFVLVFAASRSEHREDDRR